MTAPCDPEDAPEPRDEEHEIVLRLGDILPRVQPDLLKPGPHDTTQTVRFTIDELAEKIARGRVSVPLERLSSAFPSVFRDRINIPGETDVQLPLQRLLDQVGLVARKAAAASSVPGDQVALARAEAGRIIEANASRPVPEFATAPSVHSVRIAKAIFTARQVFGLFAKPEDGKSEVNTEQSVVNKSTKDKEKDNTPLPTGPEPGESAPASPAAEPPSPEAAKAPTPEPPAPVAAGSISLRVLPIFRLMPGSVLKSMPADTQSRVAIPLSSIEPQLAAGHVEVPLEDFIKALPEGLRGCLQSTPGAQVWIPLDEIFQNLPADHPFYMPPLDLDAAPTPAAEVNAEPADPKPAADAPVVPDAPAKPESPEAEAPALQPVTEPAAPVEAPVNQDPPPVNETIAPAIPVAPEPVTPPEAVAAPAEAPAGPPATEPTPTAEATPAPEPKPETAPATPEPSAEPAPAPVAMTPSEPAVPIPTPETAPAPEAAPQPGRAPWMRGFQVPPPRVFATASESTDPAAEANPATPDAAPVITAPAPAPTPEAKRTADFLADQPGIFAAAAFVEGAVFASADFPRRPDLDTLRDFMGTFIGLAEESGRRLGWNRMVTISCEQFHMTAIVRERHFVVALHHDRALPPATYDALVLAADDLGKGAEAPNAPK